MSNIIALLIVVIVGIIAGIIYHFANKEKYNNYMRAKDEVMKFVEIIEQYHTAYGTYPIIKNNTDEQPGDDIMDILIALKSPLGTPSYSRIEKLNPRMINFENISLVDERSTE